MNNQEAFDKVAEHLLKQMRKSLNIDRGRCVYRNKDGLKCAIGALIPDELYDHKMEYMGVDRLIFNFHNELQPLFADVSISLLQDLQDVHDDVSPDHWYRRLEGVADAWGLEFRYAPAPNSS
jgi:hypothetical protein